MEIVGGFMVMMSIIGLFLAVVWLIMPFVVFAIKGKQDRTLEVLEAIDRRLAELEARLKPVGPAEPVMDQAAPTGNSGCSADASPAPSPEHPVESTVTPVESATGKNSSDASPTM